MIVRQDQTSTSAARLPLGVFVSGGGTNLQAILDACANPGFPAEVVVVVSNEPEAFGISRAQAAGVPAIVVPHRAHPTRRAHEEEILRRIEPYQVELVVLAGYMRVVTPTLLKRFSNRRLGLPGVINIHPADTRVYQGAHGYEFALGLLPGHPERLTETQITVHFVDEGVDTGVIIAREAVPVMPTDTLEDLRARGLQVEHRLFPEVVRLYASGCLKLERGSVVTETQPAAARLRPKGESA